MSKVTYLGHAAFYIEGKGIKALIDPFLSGNPSSAWKPSDVKELDYIFITHGHGDHLGDTLQIAKNTDAMVIANAEISAYLTSKGLKCHSMHIGGRYTFPFGRVKLTPAWHGSGITEGDQTLCGGTPCGFLIEVEGKKLYHAGDTGLTMEMKLLEQEQVDLAMLPIGGNYVMDIDDAVRAVEFIKPKKVIPMHYDTFPVIKADPHEFQSKVGSLAGVIILEIGQSYEI
jgi:L-ascorbate metabolism protein UlaG (beta-lactamase superfamily)